MSAFGVFCDSSVHSSPATEGAKVHMGLAACAGVLRGSHLCPFAPSACVYVCVRVWNVSVSVGVSERESVCVCLCVCVSE